MSRIVLAYSGSAAASKALTRLAGEAGAEVVTLTLDLGQGKELEAVRDRALAIGAVRAHVLDAHDLFVREYLVRALKAGALADGARSLVPLLTRPLIAEKLVEVAGIEQAADVAYVSAPGDERIARAVRALAPALGVIAVAREAEAAPAAPRRSGAPAEPAVVEVAFERGAPASLNGIAMPLLDLLASLEIIAGAHGVGAATALNAAHADLQQAIVPGKGEDLARRYVAIVEGGDWFGAARPALDAEVSRLQERVNGAVRMKLFAGSGEIVDRTPAKPRRKLTVIVPQGAQTAPRGNQDL